MQRKRGKKLNPRMLKKDAIYSLRLSMEGGTDG